MKLVIDASVHERGTVETGERIGEPIRRRKLRVSPAARLIGVRYEYDERKLEREHHGMVSAFMKSRELQKAFLVDDAPRGLIPEKRYRVTHVETTRSPT